MRADLPEATTAIVVRRVGCRPIGASTVSPRAMSPAASARYSRRHRARLQLTHERRVRGQGFRDDHEAARVLVEPVHDAGARHACKLRRVMEERVGERPGPIAGAGVDDEARRLVHHDQRIVLGDDGEGDRLREHVVVSRQRCRVHDDLLAAAHLSRRRRRVAVLRHPPGVDPGPQARARELRQRAGERGVEALARGIGGQRQRMHGVAGVTLGRRAGSAGGAAWGAVGRLGTRAATSDGASAIIDVSSASIVKHVQFAAFELAGPLALTKPLRERLVALARMIACVAVLAVAGCSLLPDVVDETTNLNAEQIYKLAHDAMVEGNYTRAIKMYETLEARFPYGRYAQQAILELAYCELSRRRNGRRRSPPATASSARFPTIRMSTTPTT